MDIRPAARTRLAGVAAGLMLLALQVAPLAAQDAAPPQAGTEAPTMSAPAGDPEAGAEATVPATDPAPGDAAPATTAPGQPAATGGDVPEAAPQGATDTPAEGEVAGQAEGEAAGSAPDAGAGEAFELAPAEGASEAEATAADPLERLTRFLVDGGPAIWAIAALAVLTLALILWKIWRFFLAGAWSRGAAFRAVEAWQEGESDRALAILEGRKGTRSRLTRAAIEARLTLDETAAREEVTRAARRRLGELSAGLRALELIATIAPLLGLLGTVLGMIEAFQTLQTAGSRADPSQLAGGIWEALLTTAAGMAVAIPASAALTWFESVRDSIRADMEDIAARIFIRGTPEDLPAPAMARAAE